MPDTIIITRYILLKSVVCSPTLIILTRSAFYTDDFQFDCQQSESEV